MCFKTQGLYKCGKCPECLQMRRLDWSLRLIQQWREFGCFSALLTYRPEDVPFCKDGMSLSKRDVQLFLKRLRHLFPNEEIKYFIAGEYSPEKFRPHYHCLFFGFDKRLSKSKIVDKISQAWKKGFIGSRSDFIKSSAQINYTTGYIVNLYDWKDQDLRERPFNLISKSIAMKYHPDEKNIIKRDYDVTFDFGWHFVKGNWEYHTPISYIGRDHYIDNFGNVTFVDDSEVLIEDFFDDKIDCINIQSEHFDKVNCRTTLGSVHSFPMPRRWRESSLSRDERDVLNVVKTIKAYRRQQEYNEKYGEYDKTTDFPMWKQIKYSKWVARKKSKKDKLLKDPETYFL